MSRHFTKPGGTFWLCFASQNTLPVIAVACHRLDGRAAGAAKVYSMVSAAYDVLLIYCSIWVY